jgi:hypothetical protein
MQFINPRQIKYSRFKFYTVNTIFNSDTDTSVKDNFKSLAELVRFIDKQKNRW